MNKVERCVEAVQIGEEEAWVDECKVRMRDKRLECWEGAGKKGVCQ